MPTSCRPGRDEKHLSQPSGKEKRLLSNVLLFQEYHWKYPSHGYRWLNAKIRLDKEIVLSDPYAHKCCKIAGIKSKSKHYRYKKAGDPARIFPNLLMSEMQIDGPMQCIVSDMTAFYVKGIYHELTLYMDLWNNEIVSHSLSAKRGDRMTYISGLENLIEWQKNGIRSTKWFSILTRDRSTPPNPTTSCCPCTASPDPCHVPGHPQTMPLWSPSMDGSRRSCSWTCM
ncbi:hypothetical protein ACTQV0_02720 [Selenomonas montiformis]|uniref:hypothetical protein n=1 Tax=Selenomonas montiformis TaxID=2652285 RepID=UPI003F98F538